MERIALHVPEQLNDGSPISVEIFDSYEDELFDSGLEARIAGGGLGEEGFTTLTGVIGSWRSPGGKKYREPMRVYLLDVVEVEPALTRVLQLAQRIRVELAQEAVYVTISALDATVVTEPVPA